jgi:hypothetical protein
MRDFFWKIMQKSLLITTTQEEKIKKQLQASIKKRRKILELWMEKVETLKMELETVRNTYNIRIGYLFLKDNQLDLEIIQQKNLKRLIDEGMTYEEAIKAEEDTFYNEILRMQKEQERIEEEKSFFEKRQELPEEVEKNLKKVWKKLIRTFHPDLVTEKEEKEKRESIMKQVNKAYAEGNLDILQQIENNMHIENIDNSSVERLETILVETENLTRDKKAEFLILRKSEWYDWKKRIEKGKKANIDIFASLERKLLDDIVEKIAVIKKIRNEMQTF